MTAPHERPPSAALFRTTKLSLRPAAADSWIPTSEGLPSKQVIAKVTSNPIYLKESVMNWFKKEDPKELARKAKRETRKEVRSNQRDLDREIRDLERQEKQTIMELKQRAKTCPNQNDPALKALAKQLVQIREQRSKVTSTKAQLSALGMSAQVQASQVAAVSALSSVTDAMKSANSAMDMKKTTKIMANLQKETMTAKVREEMMDDVLADVFDSEDVEAEADQLTSQVLAELGVEMGSQMVGLDAPSQKLSQDEAAILDDVLPDLKARLNAL